ncbi:Ni,Fe-hydrogenase I cytochrome b subunit [Methylophaga thiooxydans]|uniref:Ni,Fe-hydrogenase I cytochrome b subunit n=2 Tax=Methylophaga thiooxydans TaxID=392484 RepID=A0A0A0BKP6_9GAMM|nr:cytochrome b/b6 domain-containing protein [Methylophaga thiooxydans]KGM07664.1 Ni,Fe-hydrogenase I cytochrome b subunit [Methylophaga thiooxydans]
MKQESQVTEYHVWDRSVRWFHWINVLCVLGLIAIGVAFLNSKALGITDDGKVLLKTWHVYIGYVFAINLGWRLVWGFVGNRFSRWNAVLPFGANYRQQSRAFWSGWKQGKPAAFMGHNPLARWMVMVLFLLMTVMAVTGLVLAGTDIYKPPFGSQFKEWVAESPAMIEQIKPYSDIGVDKEAYKAMRDFRAPFKDTHEITFFILLTAILLHLLGVVVTEIRERNGLISAMFTGKKVFKEKPLDKE